MYEIAFRKSFRFPGTAPVEAKLARLEPFRLVDFAKGFSEFAFVLNLEGAPHLFRFTPGFDEPVEHGLVTDSVDPLHLEDTREQGKTSSLFPESRRNMT